MKALILTIFTFYLATHKIYSQQYYTPELLNMPLLQEEGEIKAMIYSGSGYGLQSSYSLHTDMLVFANISTENGNAYMQSEGAYLTSPLINNVFDIGLGYYKSLGPNIRYELLGGIGYGSVSSEAYKESGLSPYDSSWNNYYGQWDYSNYGPAQKIYYSLSGSYYKIFFQPAIGFTGFKNHIEMGIGIRLNQVFYNEMAYTITTKDGPTNKVLSVKHLSVDDGGIFAEPCLRFAFGFKKVKLNTEIYMSYQGSQLINVTSTVGILVDIFTSRH